MLGAGFAFREIADGSRTPVLVVPDEGMLVEVEGCVRGEIAERRNGSDILARHFDRPARFLFELADVRFVGSGRGASLDGCSLLVSVFDERPDLRPRDRVRVVGRLRPASLDALPTPVDFREKAAIRGIAGILSVDGPALCRVVPPDRAPIAERTPLLDGLARVRGVLRERIRAGLLSGVPESAKGDGPDGVRSMLVALVLGDVEDGYRPVEQAFRAVGLAHILAISGFNLAVLGWVVGCAASLMTSSARLRALAVGCAAVVALILMAPAASATRAALMAIVGSLGALRGRDWNGDAIIAIAAMAMLAASPMDALNPGFQLSFVCVLALRHLAGPIRSRWFGWLPRDDGRTRSGFVGIAGEQLSRALAAGAAAFVASTPIVLAHFGTMHLQGTALTLLCAPLSSATLALAYPKAVLGMLWTPLAAPAGPVLWFLAWLQVGFVEIALSTTGGAFVVGRPPPVLVLVLAIAGVCAIVPRRRGMRIVAQLAAIAIVARVAVGFRVGPDSSPLLEVTALAVGDGSAYIVESDGVVALFDAGSSSHGGIAAQSLGPLLDARGGAIDTAFVSHPNLDHFSAMLDVVRYARVRRVVVHESFAAKSAAMPAVRDFLDGVRDAGTDIEFVRKGDVLRIGAATWTVLWPPDGFRSRRENDCSLVLRVEVAASGSRDGPRPQRMLLTGDIETEPAARLVAWHDAGGVDLAADVMELPHHGSWRPAIVPLIGRVAPSVIVQSTATRRFDADRFAEHISDGVRRFVTCRDGTVRISIGADGGISTWLFDRSVAGAWRSAGRISPRRRRRRRRDQQTTRAADPVADGAIAAIAQGEGERIGGSRVELDAERRARCSAAETDRSRGGCTGTQFDLDSAGVAEIAVARDVDRRDDRCARCQEFARHDPVDDGGCVDREGTETSRIGEGDVASDRAGDLVAVLPVGDGNPRWSDRSDVADPGGRKPDARRIGESGSERDLLADGRHRRIGGQIAPAGRCVEAHIGAEQNRAVGRANPDAVFGNRRGGRCVGERDAGDPVEADAPRFLAGILRLILRFLARLVGLAGGSRGAKDHIFRDRLDEALEPVAVDQQDPIGRVAPLDRSGASQSQARASVDGDRQWAEPAMIPDQRSGIDAMRSGKRLAVRELEDAGDVAQPLSRGSPLQSTLPLGSIAKGGERDGGAVDLNFTASAHGCEHGDRAFVDPLKPTGDPGSIHSDHLDVNHTACRGRSGGFRLRERAETSGCGQRERHACGWDVESRHEPGLSLEDREVALGHLEHDERHRGSVRLPVLGIRPCSIRRLTREEFFADRRPPLPPAVASREIHGLDGVVVPVEVVGLREAELGVRPAASRKGVRAYVVETSLDRTVLVDACVEEARDPGSGARPRGSAGVLHVAESTVIVLTLADVLDGVVDRGLRNLDAGVACAPERHDLTDGDGHVRVVRNRVVSPATFVVLAAHDELHRAHKRVAHLLVRLVHSVDLAEKQRGESVTVHRSMRLVGDEESRLRRMRQDEIERLADGVAVVAAAGNVAVGHKGDRAETRDADMRAVPALSIGTVGLLESPERLESPSNGLLELRSDLILGWRVLRALRLLGGGLGLRGRRLVRRGWRGGGTAGSRRRCLRTGRFVGDRCCLNRSADRRESGRERRRRSRRAHRRVVVAIVVVVLVTAFRDQVAPRESALHAIDHIGLRLVERSNRPGGAWIRGPPVGGWAAAR
ncbi:MAG: ComEC/Rec2 family competence protein [Planctomycetota bacterium]